MKRILAGLLASGIVIAIVCTLLFTAVAPTTNASISVKDNSASHSIVEYDIGDDVEVVYDNDTAN